MQYNDYQTTMPGVYGNAIETVFINRYGAAFLIQSPGLWPADAVKIGNRLPVDMRAIEVAYDELTIPEWIWDAR